MGSIPDHWCTINVANTVYNMDYRKKPVSFRFLSSRKFPIFVARLDFLSVMKLLIKTRFLREGREEKWRKREKGREEKWE